MIVDCYTAIWQSPEQLGPDALRRLARPMVFGSDELRMLPKADTASLMLSAESVDCCFVVGFKSLAMKAEIPNRFIADYCMEHPNRMFGFAGLDPTDPDALDQIELISREPGLKGLAIAPAAQDFHPCDTRAMRAYARAAKLKMPVIFSPGTYLSQQTRLEYARPILLDEIARTHPSLHIIIANMGRPWVDETLTLLQKHDHVLACLGSVLQEPWIAYDTLVRAHQMQVTDKLLFGSNFPFHSAAAAIETIYNINAFARNAGLPQVPREKLRQIVERDTPSRLGIEVAVGRVLANVPRNRRVARGT